MKIQNISGIIRPHNLKWVAEWTFAVRFHTYNVPFECGIKFDVFTNLQNNNSNNNNINNNKKRKYKKKQNQDSYCGGQFYLI